MAWESGDPNIAPLVAGAAIAANTIVVLNGTAEQVIPGANATTVPMGVAKAAAASGAGVGVQSQGVCRVVAGAAIAAGVAVMCGTGGTAGQAITAVTGGTNFIIGYSLQAAANQGSIISVLLNCPVAAKLA